MARGLAAACNELILRFPPRAAAVTRADLSARGEYAKRLEHDYFGLTVDIDVFAPNGIIALRIRGQAMNDLTSGCAEDGKRGGVLLDLHSHGASRRAAHAQRRHVAELGPKGIRVHAISPGASVTYYGSQMVVKNYNIMGVAKAALQSAVRWRRGRLRAFPSSTSSSTKQRRGSGPQPSQHRRCRHRHRVPRARRSAPDHRRDTLHRRRLPHHRLARLGSERQPKRPARRQLRQSLA